MASVLSSKVSRPVVSHCPRRLHIGRGSASGNVFRFFLAGIGPSGRRWSGGGSIFGRPSRPLLSYIRFFRGVLYCIGSGGEVSLGSRVVFRLALGSPVDFDLSSPRVSQSHWSLICCPIVSKAIWLILPVVICLSQRLSHACLSSHCFTVKPRMAH